jgi:hypothetical protein
MAICARIGLPKDGAPATDISTVDRFRTASAEQDPAGGRTRAAHEAVAGFRCPTTWIARERIPPERFRPLPQPFPALRRRPRSARERSICFYFVAFVARTLGQEGCFTRDRNELRSFFRGSGGQ